MEPIFAPMVIQATDAEPRPGCVRFVLLRVAGEIKAVVADISHCHNTAQIKWALNKAKELSAEYEKNYGKRN